MTEQQATYNTIAPLKNVSALMMLIKQVSNRGHGIPGMGAFYGPAGFGKSYAALFAANSEQAVVVQMKDCWTRKALCQAIMRDISAEKPAKTIWGMVDQIAEHLATTGAPLLVDEADVLVKKNMVEIVRDIYESSFSPVILIGEELLPQKLKKWERVHSRMLNWTAAQPADADDLSVLKNNLCPGLHIEPAVMDNLMTASRGSVRRMAVNLVQLKEFSQTRDKGSITTFDWSSQQFYTGEAPTPRRVLA